MDRVEVAKVLAVVMDAGEEVPAGYVAARLGIGVERAGSALESLLRMRFVTAFEGRYLFSSAGRSWDLARRWVLARTGGVWPVTSGVVVCGHCGGRGVLDSGT